MANLTLRAEKGSALTHGEVDGNFTALNAELGQGPINVKAPPYNAVGDGDGVGGGTDDTAALQAAFTAGWTNNRSVFIPAGTYRITDTLEVVSPTISYRSAHIFGEGRGYSEERQTTIDASAVTTKPALHISAGLGVVLEDFAVIGPNVAPNNQVQGEQYYDSAWVSVGLRDERYSPQCGVCVDGNTGTDPGGGQGYPGFTYKGNTNASVDLVFNRILFKNHVVGLMLCPSSALNADQIAIRDCQFILNKVAIANGQAQTKATVFFGGNVLRAQTAYDGLTYGQRQGRGPQFVGTQFLQCFQLISWSAAFGPAVFLGCFAEQSMCIGYGGSAEGLANGINFYGTEILFHSDAGSTRAPILFEGRFTPLNWYGGRLGAPHKDTTGTDRQSAAYNIIALRAVLDGVEIQFNDKHKPFAQGPAALEFPVILRNVRAADGQGGGGVVYGSERRASGFSMAGRVSAHHDNPRLTITPYNAASTTYDYVRTVNAGEVATFTSSTYAFAATTMTFAVSADVALNFLVGDVVYWRMNTQGASVSQHIVPALRVTDVTGTTVTCEYLFRRVDYDEAYSPGASTYIAVVHWAPGQALTCSTTDASASITAVSPTTILRNGDWIMAAAGISANTRVVSGGGTASITLNRPATDTSTGKVLYFDRLHTPTTTAAF